MMMKRQSLVMVSALVMMALVVSAGAAEKKAGDRKAKGELQKSALEWSRAIDFGAVYTDGNTETTDLSYGFDFGVKNDVNSARWTLAGLYGEDRDAEGDDVTKNKVESAIRGEHLLSPRQGLFLTGSYLYDECADVDYAFMVSPGYVVYLLKDTDVLELSFEAGPAGVFRRDGDEERNYVTARVAERFLWAFSKVASLEQTVEYLPDLGGDADGDLINGSVTLTSAMTDYLALKLGATDKYNGAPAEGAEKNDLAITASLQVRF